MYKIKVCFVGLKCTKYRQIPAADIVIHWIRINISNWTLWFLLYLGDPCCTLEVMFLEPCKWWGYSLIKFSTKLSFSNGKCTSCKTLSVCWNVGNFWSIMQSVNFTCGSVFINHFCQYVDQMSQKKEKIRMVNLHFTFSQHMIRSIRMPPASYAISNT